ncbi:MULTISPECIES: KinB-signaling pathway activation protein [Nosocomiicoccus]|uniref:KinB-signaling pathway activation protein n=1 Tax=Nosocomiicoccus massiliensis TaxID=1232430 RepID=A0AAF0YJQ1_9STAP|nr:MULTISPECIES: KinB-signaling pathway activation protein [Nosocomiicoccus]MDK6864029.1 KinB-signaling pathway activation protein [Nosocomiicoccus ampullae]WOS95890.1 KinB-signaling pathway activation protein [Nosocomiicoccus massiliensis]
MSSKYVVKFYFTTLIIGVIASTFISLFTEYENVTSHLFKGDFSEFFVGLIWIIGYGLIIATVAQVVFYIYLFINPLGLGIFRSFWPYVQILLIMYAIFDLFYLRFFKVGKDHGSTFEFIWIPIIVVIVGFVVAYVKNKQVEKNIFIPSLFFMIFMTSLTLLPFISVEDTTWIYRSIFTVLILNAYQLLRLPKYIEASREDKIARGIVNKDK